MRQASGGNEMKKEDFERIGAAYLPNGRCAFTVWAPFAKNVELELVSPIGRRVGLESQRDGYHYAVLEGIASGSLYYCVLDGKDKKPDPASRSQPQGVHGPSEVISQNFEWKDSSWHGISLEQYIIYEIHAGVFTDEGTFEAIIPLLKELKFLGITAIELMPVAQFPGNRNWGYDGVFPFAVQQSYGGPVGLKRLVNACHMENIAVVMDVVYNHLGPEGNYLGYFAPYFNNQYQTPWGQAINFDAAYSDEVRNFFIKNALYWIEEFHIDSLRLDALHAIMDLSPVQFLQDLASAVHGESNRLDRKIYLFAESDRNDARLVKPIESGGIGLDVLWNDDFHHSLHTLLTGEQHGYYKDFDGFNDLVKSLGNGFVYTGQYSNYRKRRHGSFSRDLPASNFAVFSQNHDQVGNRLMGERLSQLVPFKRLKLAAGAVLLSPFVPLLFMGEEYGETAPFLYFVSHSDPELIEATRQGRRAEFSSFSWQGEPPDPQDESTFLRSKLHRELIQEGWHAKLYEFYRELINIRRVMPALSKLDNKAMELTTREDTKLLAIRRWVDSQEVFIILNFGEKQTRIELPFPGNWQKELDSEEQRWGGDKTSLHVEVESSGENSLSIEPESLVVYSLEKQ
jgi:maltooligosyltrehalose trehalohydrolase